MTTTTTARLELSYERGKLFAAYLYLPRTEGDRSVRTLVGRHGVVIDYGADGRPIGIEFTAPSRLTRALVDEALATAYGNSAARPPRYLVLPELRAVWLADHASVNVDPGSVPVTHARLTAAGAAVLT